MKLLTEVKNAKLSDNLICIQMDANRKLGKQVITQYWKLKLYKNASRDINHFTGNVDFAYL